MNDKTANRGPNLGLLLLIPAGLIVAKAAMHRRAMWESSWGPTEARGRGFGRHRHFGPSEGSTADASGFRLPPKIEWILDTWHTRAHESSASPTAPGDGAKEDGATSA